MVKKDASNFANDRILLIFFYTSFFFVIIINSGNSKQSVSVNTSAFMVDDGVADGNHAITILLTILLIPKQNATFLKEKSML